MRIFFARILPMKLNEFLSSEESVLPHYLLIGKPVSHSVSPLMHNTALQHHGITARYFAVDVEMSEIGKLAAHFNRSPFRGANITIPHKQNFLEAVDELTDEARKIGAINTILKKENKLTGHNTDAFGFAEPLKEFEDEFEPDRAIIFGSGGATKAIVYALSKMGFGEIVMVSRNPGRAQSEIAGDIILSSYDAWQDYADEATLIINATPLGMLPDINTSPVQDNETGLLAGKICYDIVYNPRKTKFLRQAKQEGGIPVGGLDMLIYQGAESFRLWTGKEFPVGLVKMKLDEQFPY